MINLQGSLGTFGILQGGFVTTKIPVRKIQTNSGHRITCQNGTTTINDGYGNDSRKSW
ncbi:MAG: hypothetical protein P8179_16725 [Candidatus Thiodiazotropha sp.]|jgi:hypothetical protein